MNKKDQYAISINLAETIRQICMNAARDGFEEASLAGLCTEGAIDYAVDAIRKIDLNKIIDGLSSQ